MNDLILYRTLLLAAALFFAGFAVWTARLNPERLPRFEPWPRLRLPALFIGWIVLALCVPHARVIAPSFLQPLLWPLAAVVPVLGYLYVDYPLARAAAGAGIIGSYYLVHKSFDFATPGYGALAVLAWVFGFLCIWVSGKPCALRDWIRLCCRSLVWRTVFTAFWGVLALALAWGAWAGGAAL